jgi:hypothetical protein
MNSYFIQKASLLRRVLLVAVEPRPFNSLFAHILPGRLLQRIEFFFGSFGSQQLLGVKRLQQSNG